jgi:hypothetical protein
MPLPNAKIAGGQMYSRNEEGHCATRAQASALPLAPCKFSPLNLNAHGEKVHPKKCACWALMLLALVRVLLASYQKKKRIISISKKSFKNNQKVTFFLCL